MGLGRLMDAIVKIVRPLLFALSGVALATLTARFFGWKFNTSSFVSIALFGFLLGAFREVRGDRDG